MFSQNNIDITALCTIRYKRTIIHF